MSELIQNLTYIYNEKLLLKDAIGTESDDFMQYHTYVNALKPSGTSYITSNGDYDISSYSYVNVDVEGGGSGSSADPFYDCTTPSAMISNEEESADFVSSTISDNFTVTLDANEEEVEAVEWDENITIDVEGTNVDKVVHVIVNGDPHDMLSTASTIESNLEDYSDLYDNIYPTLENATLTASEDPSEDGYDYLLEGDLYAWNLCDNYAQVTDVTENGFYPSSADGSLGFNVNVDPIIDNFPIYENLIFINAEKEQSFSTGTHTIFNTDKIYRTYNAVVYQESDPETDDFIEVSVLNYSGTPSILTANVTNISLGGYAYKILTRVRGVNTNDGVDFALTLNISGSVYEEININGSDNLVDFSNDEVIHFNSLDGNTIYFFMPTTMSTVNNKPIVYIYNWNSDVLVQDEDFTIESLE